MKKKHQKCARSWAVCYALTLCAGQVYASSDAAMDRDAGSVDAIKEDAVAASHDLWGEGVVWRLNISSEEADRALSFVQDYVEEPRDIIPLELPEIQESSYVDENELVEDSVEIVPFFQTMYDDLPAGIDMENYEPLIPDSFAKNAKAYSRTEPDAVDQPVSRVVSEAVSKTVSQGALLNAQVQPYVTNPLGEFSLPSLSQHAATVPLGQRGRVRPLEAVYINYPSSSAVQGSLGDALDGGVSVDSREPHGRSSRFYALPSSVNQQSLFEVIAQNEVDQGAGVGSGSSGGVQLRSPANTRTVVVDSSQAWSARPINGTGFTETWSNSGNAEGWVSRDGEMTVGQINTFGNPSGALQGTFAAGVLFPQTDAFTVDSVNASGTQGENFIGDYGSIGYWNGWAFDFYAEDVLPSDLIFRITDGSQTFLYNFASQVTSVGVWHQIRIRPDPSKWVGGSANQFLNTIENVTQIDIQITRNGFGEQDFFVDNFNYTGNQVPEPSTLGFLLLGNALFLLRFQMARREKRALQVDEH